MKKKTYIELLRIIAAFFVIVNHTNSTIFMSRTPGLTWLCSVTYFFLCKTAVPVFLLIMGALLLEKTDTPRQTRQRFLRIFAVFFVSSLVCAAYLYVRKGTPFTIGGFLSKLLSGSTARAYWYFCLYLGLLCSLPILQTLVKALTGRQLEYLLFLSVGVCGTAPLIAIFFPALRLSPLFTAGLVGPYIGLVLLGYYLERVPLSRKRFWLCLGGYIVLLVLQTAGTCLLYHRDPSNYLALDDRTLITITASAACLFYCVKYSKRHK